MDTFRENPYLNLITFDRNVIFDVFAEKWSFFMIFWHLWFSGVFSLFLRCQVFPWKVAKMTNLLINFMKIPKMNTFGQNVTDRSDTPKSALFGHFFVKNCQFRQKPLGLDRGFSHFCQFVLPWSPLVSPWCHFCHFSQKPLGLDRGFGQNHGKSLFLRKNHCF